MAEDRQQTSKVTVLINGDTIRSKAGSSTMDIGGWVVAGEPEYTSDGSLSFKETRRPSKISTTLIHMADSDLHAIRDTRAAMVTYRTDTGLEFSMAKAMCTVCGDLQDGECQVTFMGEAIPTPSKALPPNPF